MTKGSGIFYWRGLAQPGTQRLHCLELPVLLQRRTGSLELEAGPQLSFVLTQRTDQTDAGGHHTITTGPAGLRRVQGGYIVGVGYRAAAGLGVGLRYSRGLTSVSIPSGLSASSFQLQASYRFRPAPAAQ